MDLVSDLFKDDSVCRPQTVGVAVAANVWRQFDYIWPVDAAPPQVGMRLRVPFGRSNRKTLGFVARTDRPPGQQKLKVVAELIDTASQLDKNLLKLAEWMSRYYLAPPGMVLSAMVPAAVGRTTPRTETVAYLLAEKADWPRALGSRQRRLLDELFEASRQGVEPVPVEQLLAHSGGSRDTVRRLVRRELIRTKVRPQKLEQLDEQIEPDPFDLNDDQRKVLEAVKTKLASGFSATLLHGVTASGKTEVYLRAIREVVAAGKQAILLVPEIALATQTLHRLASRLPRVAVLHSGLTAAQRAFYYEQIRDGRATTVIGPRSAIFAPARRLGLIIVDEEHESSYKQETVPRYHGRDVAVKRAAIEGVPVLLGSATPSLESLRNVQTGRYELLELPRRIHSLPLPALRLVELRKEITPGRIELVGKTLGRKLAETLDRGEQTILLMNRRGYASFVFCPSCRWQLECEHCSRAMVFHSALSLAMCHYCQATAEVPRACPACGKKLILFGMGIQRIESELARKFPTAVVARMDSDTMSAPGQFREVFDRFAAGDVDILLGTQMVAKGLDFPRVTLVGIVSADTALAIPDFRAAERTFQLIVQVAGRAGRAKRGGEVVVQTLHPSDPAIRFALKHDYTGFAAFELPQRRATGVPPFVRLVRLIVRHEKVARAESGARALGKHLDKLFAARDEVRIVGPMRAGVFKIRRQFRFEIDCYCPKPGHIQNVLLEKIHELNAEIGAELVIDADPANLL
ncbi:MAG: primosomal protein N' [Planctomycetota bacterium]|nr:primosomal protein N' [Planctomycetota bacterium]